jgi:hypothetical protein
MARKMPMRRNNRPYVMIEDDVLVDAEVLEHLHAHSLRVIFHEMRSPYPIIVDMNGAMRELLHRFTYGFVHGFEMLRDENYVVHHRRPNKKNCRSENLELRLRADHARVHRLLEKKMMEQYDVAGLWRPHEKRPVVSLDPDAPLEENEDGCSARELYVAPSEWPREGTGRLSLAAQLRLAEQNLDLSFDALDKVTRCLDSGAPIPKTRSSGSSRDADSRAAGVTPIRLGCLRSEAALVRLLALHEQEDGSFDMETAGKQVGIHPSLFAHFLRRPAVAVAIERWRKYRRLPKVCPPGWWSKARRRTG